MKIKEFLKKAAKEGAKAGGKTILKSALDPKTWFVAYMAILATKAYNKIGLALDREAAINQAAARRIEQMTETPEQMKKVCEMYELTEEQVQEVIDLQKELSNTEKVILKTAEDRKKNWRDWLLGARALRDTAVESGVHLDVPAQTALALDSYEAAEKELQLRKKEAVKSAGSRGN